MKINFVTPRLFKDSFSGGILCILQHANLLVERGHEVNVIPQLKSVKPEWIDLKANLILDEESRTGVRLQKTLFGKKRYKSKPMQDALTELSILQRIPPADVTIATAWQTADLVLRSGMGKPALFAQHFDPIFEETVAEREKAAATYYMPLYILANSRWLKETISQFQGLRAVSGEIYPFSNSIDLTLFKPSPASHTRNEKHVVLISYGGRNVPWKGFQQMAEAVAQARARLPEYELEWRVYGSAALPPNNPIAHYRPLGFLQSPELARAYNDADLLLSASWFESFPLFPLEGMAAGLAVICGQKGTEDYAENGKNVEWVDSLSVPSITDAIVKLSTDTAYRKQLGAQAAQDAQAFNWNHASETLEQALLQIVATGNQQPTLQSGLSGDLGKILYPEE